MQNAHNSGVTVVVTHNQMDPYAQQQMYMILDAARQQPQMQYQMNQPNNRAPIYEIPTPQSTYNPSGPATTPGKENHQQPV